MAWTSHGDAVCDSCGDMRLGNPDRHQAIQVIRAAGWHHFCGTTIGGVSHEVILCRLCVKDEHKRPKKTLLVDQEEQLPIDWGTGSAHGSGSGISSR